MPSLYVECSTFYSNGKNNHRSLILSFAQSLLIGDYTETYCRVKRYAEYKLEIIRRTKGNIISTGTSN